jgi:FkbM family methyltransferase
LDPRLALYSLIYRVRPTELQRLLAGVLASTRQTVRTVDGQAFSVDPVSHLGHALLFERVYEPELTRLVQTVLRPGDVFLDVGANEGYFSVVGAAAVGETGRVLAIEPQSRLRPIIDENLRLNAARNVEVAALAFSAEDGEATLYLTSEVNTGGSSFYRRGWRRERSERVRTQTLDRFLDARAPGRVRLGKLDCEGAEWDIVRGASGALSAGRFDFLSIDYHPHIVGPGAAVQIDRELRRCGYMLTRAGNGCWVYHRPGLEEALAPLGAHSPVPPLGD